VALIAAIIAIGGAPLVARAIGDDAGAIPGTTETRVVQPAALRANPIAAVRAEPRSARIVEPVIEPVIVDPVIAVLVDTYTWDERSARVAVLQQALGVTADGWYGRATQRAHRNALAFVGLPIDTAPVPVLPPGPDPSKWAALRECESNGNYSITNPSGRYRGAYQFDRSTWNSIARRHAPHLVGVDPAAALPADQDAMALALYSERGARPWPHCGRHLS
jgi:peptidoglycan hydrolase-like protein with peptidoglycan-binding domain